MDVNTVALSDGGRVEWWVVQDPNDPHKGEIHTQKYDSAGHVVGSEYAVNLDPAYQHAVYALNNGGYVIGEVQSLMDGPALVAEVFRPDATMAKQIFGGTDWHIATSPDGGFVVGSHNAQHHAFTALDSKVVLYDNNGAVVTTANVSSQAGPQVSVDAEGTYHASWTDGGGNPHSIAIDPQNPPTFTPPPAPAFGSFGLVDDVGPDTGFRGGGGIDDNTPTVRVNVSQTGYLAYEIAYDGGSFAGNQALTNPTNFVRVTAQDVARGYVDIAVTSPLSDGNKALAVRFENDDGIVGAQSRTPFRIDTIDPGAATISKAVDDAGAQTGDLANGASTDDTTPDIQVSLSGAGAQPMDDVLLFDNGRQIGIGDLTADDVSRGYVTFRPTLAAGSHSFTAIINDFGGNRGPESAAFNLTVDTSAGNTGGQRIVSDQYGDQLTGGAGADTLVAGQGPDLLTGNGGADVFRFENLPWNSGHVTDFTVGTDRLDLSALLQASGYTGSNPIADHYVTLQNNGAGGTAVYYDTDGAASGNTIQYLITTLDHVAAGGLTWAQVSGGGSGGSTGPASTAQISPTTVTHTEGNSGTTTYSFTVTRTGDTSQGGVTSYQIAGSGAHPADGADFGQSALGGGSFGWGPGETSHVITLNVTGDTTVESDETFQVILQGTSSVAVGANATATGVITNDDGAPTPSGLSITALQSSVTEGGVAQFRVERTGDASGAASVDWSVTNGSTGAGDFINGTSGTVSFAAGQTVKFFSVQTAQDSVQEPDESFQVTLSNASGATITTAAASTVITDDDGPSTGGQRIVSHQYGDQLTGGSGNDTLVAGQGPDVLTGNGGGDVFRYENLPWNAGHVTDFAVGTDRLDLSALFAASGYSGSDPLLDGYVSMRDDGAGGTTIYYDTDGRASGNTIQFKITTLDHVAYGTSWAQLAGTAAPQPHSVVEINPATVTHAEGNAGTTTFSFTVTRTGDVGSTAQTLYQIVGSGAHPADGSDFATATIGNGMQINWAAGETSRTLTVNVAGDTSVEGDESFQITLSGTATTSVGANGSATGVIQNDDGAPPPPPPQDGQVYQSDQYGDQLTGGSGSDTLIAGQGPDQLTGAGGADVFRFNDLPWNAGHVTDFTVGVDKLDLRGLFAAAGYRGSNPIADHYLEFRSDGQGNTQVYFDRDGNPTAGDWPYLITTLDHVSPGQIGAGDWLFQ